MPTGLPNDWQKNTSSSVSSSSSAPVASVSKLHNFGHTDSITNVMHRQAVIAVPPVLAVKGSAMEVITLQESRMLDSSHTTLASESSYLLDSSRMDEDSESLVNSTTSKRSHEDQRECDLMSSGQKKIKPSDPAEGVENDFDFAELLVDLQPTAAFGTESTSDTTISVVSLLSEYRLAIDFKLTGQVVNVSQFVEKLKQVVALKQDVKMRDKDMNSLLHCACRFRRTDVAKILLDAGADVHQPSSDLFLPLHIACHCSALAIIVFLLENGAVVDDIDNHRRTALSVACEFGMKDVAVVLLEHGANPNMFDEYLKRPLHYSAEFAHDDLMDILTVDYEASHRNFVMIRTPLHWAALSGHLGTCRKLIAQGDYVNPLDANDDSPLILARTTSNLKVVELLVPNNVAVDVVNLNAKTALYHADDEDYLEKLSFGLKQ
eukprot:gene44992-56005_t